MHDAVFEWLNDGLISGPPAYLQLLGPSRADRTFRVLANLGAVVNRLRDQPGRWNNLIRARNWRHTLVGCSAVLLTREMSYFDDLFYRFRNGSWVSPQLAVTLGLVHPVEAVAELEGILRDGPSRSDPKNVFAAYAVLKLMGREAADEFEAGDLFRTVENESPSLSPAAYDKLVAVKVVLSHWEFWTSRTFVGRE